MDGELLDWEILHGSDTESTGSLASEKKSGNSSVIDDGMFHSDHFSVDNLIERHGEITGPSQYDFVESGDSSRGDYGLESPNRRQNLSEVLVDLSPDQSDVHRLGDARVGNELGFNDCTGGGSVSKTGISGDGEISLSEFEAADEKNVKSKAAAELAGVTLSNHEDASKRLLESDDREVLDENHFQSQAGVEEPSETLASYEDSSKSWSDSGVVNGEDYIGLDSGVVSTEEIEGIGGDTVEREVEAVNSAVVSGDESKSREIVWWKMPFVLVKYYAFKIGPVWSVSMAAALMGIVLLGRRLYNAKKKAQRFHLKVTVDDKKVSRVMSQAARLNEVFTEVRRVPVIRPALPSPGAWPVLTLR